MLAARIAPTPGSQPLAHQRQGVPRNRGAGVHQDAALALETPLHDEQDFAARMRAAATITLLAPVAELASAPVARVRLPWEVLGADGMPTDTPLAALLK